MYTYLPIISLLSPYILEILIVPCYLLYELAIIRIIFTRWSYLSKTIKQSIASPMWFPIENTTLKDLQIMLSLPS